MAEYIEREALVHHFMTTRQYLTKDLVMDAAYEVSKFPAADVVPVVRCRECVLSGNCSAEDTFRLVAGIDDPYCCVGKRKEENPCDHCMSGSYRGCDGCSHGERKDGEG